MVLLPILFFAHALLAQVVPARQKPADYPVHAQAAAAGIGAEFMVHVAVVEGKSYFVPDYFVVEVAVFPDKSGSIQLLNEHFALRINGKKQELKAQTPGFAAASLKYPDWTKRPSATASAGVGNGGIVIGRPRTQPRFPGDERPPRSTAPTQSAGIPDKEQLMTAAEAVVAAALNEVRIEKPAAGYLYFPYRGDGKKAGKIELIYRGPAGEVTLPLR